MVRTTSLTLLLSIIAWSQLAHAKPNTLLVSLRREGRRLRNAHIHRVASRVNYPGKECVVNITSLRLLQEEVIRTTPGCDLKKMCEDLLGHDEIQGCEPDYDVELHIPKAERFLQASPAASGYDPNGPDDPYFQSCEQWGLTKIEAEAAWRYDLGNSGNTIVAVVDSGINLVHKDLVDALWTNPGIVNGVDTDNNGYMNDLHGWNGVEQTGSPMDDNGHGTHCAGIIGATGNNGVGIIGVSQARLMALRFTSKSQPGSMAVANELLNYALMNGAHIGSWSLGSSSFSSNTLRVMQVAETKGHLFSISAGNDGTNNSDPATPQYPCNFDLPNVICVGASDEMDNKASFSNYGKEHVDVFAPGTFIRSTWAPQTGGVIGMVMDGDYKLESGTSMAGPHVSGLAALILDFKPAFTYAQIKAIIVFTADVIPALVPYSKCGGRINARRAMAAAAVGYIPTDCASGQRIPGIDVASTGYTPTSRQVPRQYLFAVMDGKTCTKSLPYGPQAALESGGPYFSTMNRTALHRKWVQKISLTGVANKYEYTITYEFGTEKTLAQRLDDAVSFGEPVTWTIQTPSATLTKQGTFMYSDNLPQDGALKDKLEGEGTTFSSLNGAWGAATGVLNGNCVHDPTRRDRRKCPTDFYGILDDYADTGGQLTPEATSCSNFYAGNMNAPTSHPNMRVFMYLEIMEEGAPVTVADTVQGSARAPQHCLSTEPEKVAATMNFLQNHWWIIAVAVAGLLFLWCCYRTMCGTSKKGRYSKIGEHGESFSTHH